MRWITTYRRLLVATPLLAGCVIFESKDTDLLADLVDARARWEAGTLVDYTMIFQRQCIFCPIDLINPVELTVRDGVIEEVFDLELQVTRTDWVEGTYLTVSELFDTIQESIEEQASEIDVTYDGALGYPTEIHIDFNRRFVDDDIDIFTRDVAPIS
jgi:hypothetical protein